MSRVSELLSEMLSHLERIEPAIADSFRAPVAKDGIESLVCTTQQSIPSDLMDFWNASNGQDLDSSGIFDGEYRFLSVEETLEDWLIKKEVFGSRGGWAAAEATPEVQPEVWLQAWIPFALAPSGNTLCVDMAPTKAGQKGQVIETTVAGIFRCRISASFVEWFEDLATDFRANRFSPDFENEGYIVHDRSET